MKSRRTCTPFSGMAPSTRGQTYKYPADSEAQHWDGTERTNGINVEGRPDGQRPETIRIPMRDACAEFRVGIWQKSVDGLAHAPGNSSAVSPDFTGTRHAGWAGLDIQQSS